MNSELPRNCEVVYTAGVMAVDAGDPISALKLFRAALEDGLDGPHAVEACVVCCGILYDLHDDKEALAMGENALFHDRQHLREQPNQQSKLDTDPFEREQFLVRLDSLWGQAADNIERAHGPRAALTYLLTKLTLTDHLSSPGFPCVYIRLGEYAVETGKKEEAKRYYQNVLDAKLTALDDEAAQRQYVMMRVGAEMELEKLSDSNSKSDSSCWVATVIYGRESQEVRILRTFRDTVLSDSALGRVFINSYYYTGPHIANAARRSWILRWLLRAYLSPAVVLIRRLISPRGGSQRGS
jgi:hypothetical protein